MQTVKVAAIQASPVFLDTEATLAKACGLIEKAAAEGAEVMVFPETFLPSYPDWVWRTTPWSDAEWFKLLAEQAVVVPGPVTERLGEAAASAGAYVAMGVTERDEWGG